MFGEYDEYDDDEYDDEEYEEEPARETRRTPLRDVNKDREPEYSSPSRRNSSNSRANPNVYSINTNVQMQVVVIQPTCYEDAEEICDHIKEEKPVVINLEKVEYTIAQRIMDFLSGTCYSLEGSIQKVTNNIFVIAPENVEISSELEEIKSRNNMAFSWASNT
jgi:cell division inhibitor SepF